MGNLFLSLIVALATVPAFCNGTGDIHTFAKVGDSITAEHFYLYPVGNLQEVVFDGTTDYLYPDVLYYNPSFGRESKAAVPGFRTYDLLQPDVNCDGKTFLACEYDEINPRYAVIMIGTNDPANWLDEGFSEYNYREILKYTVSRGIIPVLTTIPPNINKDVLPFNAMVRKLAKEKGYTLIEYHDEMTKIPYLGLRADAVHPSVPPTGSAAQLNAYGLQYGYPLRNLLTLQALHYLRLKCDPKWTLTSD